MEHKCHREKLKRVMESFSYTTNVPVTFFDKDMNIIWECLAERKFCTVFSKHNNYNTACLESLERAVMTSINMGEPYVFMCASELIGIIYPLSDESGINEIIMVGPTVVSKNKDTALKKLFKTMPDFRSYVNEVLDLIDINGIKSTVDMSYLFEVFCNCIFSYRLIKDSATAETNLINNITMAIKGGDKETAITNLDLLCERTYITNAGNVNQIKIHILECIDKILDTLNLEGEIYQKNYKTIDNVKDAISSEEIFLEAKQFIINLMSSWSRVFNYDGTSEVINNAISYLFDNYSRDIELNELANVVHANASYLSLLFKKETGLTFSQCLNGIRIEKSMHLLENTSLSIEEIGSACGFSSQSYFIKTFKKNLNISPGKYRSNFLKK